MKLQIVTGDIKKTESQYIALPVFEGKTETFGLPTVESFLKENPKFGKLYETQLLYSPKQKILLVGAGKREQLNFERAQNIAGTAVKGLLSKTSKVYLQALGDQWIEAMVIGTSLAAHDSTAVLKSVVEKPKLESILLVVSKTDENAKRSLERGEILAESINRVRDMGDAPANRMTPTAFVDVVGKVAKENNLKLTVLGEEEAAKKGMGAFCGVAQGSDEPSFMIALEYSGDPKASDKWSLVGKGITFDTGGISIKPADRMNEMKYDMLGAAAVVGAMESLARLKVRANVVGVMAVTENNLGAKAQRPGDVVKSYGGKTVEIENTDAEGRLVLLDAISYAQKDFKANKLVDIATLTGAIIIALGDFIAGAFGNSPEFTQKLIKVGREVGERYWEMPMDEEFDEWIKSDFADILNSARGGSTGWRPAGSTTGAKFIEVGVEKKNKWIHLDIGGTAWDMKARSFRNPGATGFGVKTLVKLIEEN